MAYYEYPAARLVALQVKQERNVQLSKVHVIDADTGRGCTLMHPILGGCLAHVRVHHMGVQPVELCNNDEHVYPYI